MPLQLPIAPEVQVGLPRLASGDRLDRQEFERRYTADRTITHAELIEGVVYVASPLRVRAHAEPHGRLMAWLGLYYMARPGLILADNATLILDDRNEVQPDAMLFDPQGGQAIVTEDDYVSGAPELVAEVAGSSTAIDLHTKKTLYERFGVREYLVWSTGDRRLDWFVLQGDHYVDLEPDELGIFRSQIFTGLWLDGRALLEGNLAQVSAIAQAGLASARHSDS